MYMIKIRGVSKLYDTRSNPALRDINLDIESGGEESYIFDVCYILTFQKHITKKELKDLITT